MKKIISRGFTLIELLVVVAIIAIIASLLIVSISASRAKSRDARRIADLSSIQLALETYRDGKGSYPTTQVLKSDVSSYWIRSDINNYYSAGGADPSADIQGDNPWTNPTTSLQAKLSSYLQVLPKDPIEGREYSDSSSGIAIMRPFRYEYGATTANYKLTAHLEQNDNVMTEDNGEYPYLYEIYTSGAKAWFTDPMNPL